MDKGCGNTKKDGIGSRQGQSGRVFRLCSPTCPDPGVRGRRQFAAWTPTKTAKRTRIAATDNMNLTLISTLLVHQVSGRAIEKVSPSCKPKSPVPSSPVPNRIELGFTGRVESSAAHRICISSQRSSPRCCPLDCLDVPSCVHLQLGHG